MDRSCQFCSERFPVTKSWQLFCSSKCRVRYHREYKGYCFFCGEPDPQTRHHLYPVSVRGGPRMYQSQETVMACNECNNALGSMNWATVDDQFLRLLEFYEKKRGPAKPAWDDDEISELGPRLRQRIRKMLSRYERYQHKILYLEIRRADVERRAA